MILKLFWVGIEEVMGYSDYGGVTIKKAPLVPRCGLFL